MLKECKQKTTHIYLQCRTNAEMNRRKRRINERHSHMSELQGIEMEKGKQALPVAPVEG